MDIAGTERQDRPPQVGGTARLLLFGAAALIAAGAVIAGLRSSRSTGSASSKPTPPPLVTRAAAPAEAPIDRLFRGWPRDRKPDLVVLLSGQVYGYLQPCGCSDPQYGGLERRYNFVQALTHQRGWPIVLADLGDVAQKGGPQALIKYRYTLEAMKHLHYTATGIGETETTLPLLDALADYALNTPTPRVICANLKDRESKYPGMVAAYAVVARPGLPTVGLVSVVAPSVAGAVRDPDVKFTDAVAAIDGVLQQQDFQDQKPEFLVLLYQGDEREAQELARRFPRFQVVQCLTLEEEPPGQPLSVGNTWVVEVGHKGRHVGVVGAYRTTNPNHPFALYYESAQLGPEYKTPEGHESENPILGLMEDYAREVKDRNYLARYPKRAHPVQQAFPGASYVGSAKCKSCHRESYRIWEASPHSKAYETLVNAKRPSLRQFDGECIVCHVTGFEYPTGFTSAEKTQHLEANGCENCHGPGSVHIAHMRGENAGKEDAKLLALMNPCKTKPGETAAEKSRREIRLNDSCQKCHDTDNDVHWKLDKWVTGKIVHKENSD